MRFTRRRAAGRAAQPREPLEGGRGALRRGRAGVPRVAHMFENEHGRGRASSRRRRTSTPPKRGSRRPAPASPRPRSSSSTRSCARPTPASCRRGTSRSGSWCRRAAAHERVVARVAARQRRRAAEHVRSDPRIGRADVYVGEPSDPGERPDVLPVADPAANTFRVRVNLPEDAATLFPGMFVKVGFVVGETRKAAHSRRRGRAAQRAVRRLRRRRRARRSASDPARPRATATTSRCWRGSARASSRARSGARRHLRQGGRSPPQRPLTPRAAGRRMPAPSTSASRAASPSASRIPRSRRCWPWSGCCSGCSRCMVTPREEEPQINVTFADIFVPFPGASASEVENLVAGPAEQVLSEIEGSSMSFRSRAPAWPCSPFSTRSARTHGRRRASLQQVSSNQGLAAAESGRRHSRSCNRKASTTFRSSRRPSGRTTRSVGAFELAQVAHALEQEIKRVPGTRDVYTVGAPDRWCVFCWIRKPWRATRSI
jgi:hypothetical protein